jgi:hypothetical protein
MTTTEQQRHQRIALAVRALPNSADTDVALILWQRLAAELTVVIGDRGFASLYWRSPQRLSVPPGKKIEWHFSDKAFADHMRGIFDGVRALQGDSAISVVYTPDIVN